MPLIEDVIEIIEMSDKSPAPIPKGISSSEFKNIAYFEELLSLKNLDWSTEAMGSLIIKNLKNMRIKCYDYVNLYKKEIMMPIINDIFTIPKQNITLSDIALVYTAMDFRILSKKKVQMWTMGLEKGQFDDSPQLNNYLKSCLEEVQSKTLEKQTTLEKYINKHIGYNAKYMEPSPCFNLETFPTCKQYCTWHRNFFQEIPKNEFLTIMKYSIPQRKIR